MSIPQCLMSHYSIDDANLLMRHIVCKHQKAASFIVYCNASGCGASFLNYGTFRKHSQGRHQYTSEIVTCEPNFDHYMIIDDDSMVSGVMLEKAEAAFSKI